MKSQSVYKRYSTLEILPKRGMKEVRPIGRVSILYSVFRSWIPLILRRAKNLNLTKKPHDTVVMDEVWIGNCVY
jgi:hypothetical protein